MESKEKINYPAASRGVLTAQCGKDLRGKPRGIQPERRLKILFLCTGNSCRSQMAEAWARYLKGDIIEAHSAGAKDEKEAMIHYRQIRDEIRAYVETLPESVMRDGFSATYGPLPITRLPKFRFTNLYP
jgi:hypothetical protein